MFRVPPVSDDLVGLRAETEDSEGAGSISYTPPVFRYLILVAVAHRNSAGKCEEGDTLASPILKVLPTIASVAPISRTF